MIKFLCPFLVTDLKQIPINLVAKYDLGFEGVIFDGIELEKKFNSIKKNLIQLQKKFPNKLISLHYPTDNANYVKGGKELSKLFKFIEMAQELGIEKIILHSNYFLKSGVFDQSLMKLHRLRYISIFKKIEKILNGSGTKVCIENMPIIGNKGDDFDSIFVFPEDFALIKKFKNIKINWDFGHWAITYKLLLDIKRFSTRTALLNINFSEYLRNEKNIIHFHLSSFSGNTFINCNSFCKEGVPPAVGDIDELHFIKALERIQKKDNVIHISLEINEKDYYKRLKLKETLIWLRRYKFI